MAAQREWFEKDYYKVLGVADTASAKDITKALPTDMNIRIVQPALLHALKEAGWVDKGLCMSSTYTTKRHVFVKPELAHLSKAQIRDVIGARENGLESANVLAFKG